MSTVAEMNRTAACVPDEDLIRRRIAELTAESRLLRQLLRPVVRLNHHIRQKTGSDRREATRAAG